MLKPIGSKLLIEPLIVEGKTQTGILLPETTKEKPQRGRVAAIGSGKTKDNGMKETIDVTAGDVVYFTKYSPIEIKIDNKEYYIIDFDDVLGIEQ